MTAYRKIQRESTTRTFNGANLLNKICLVSTNIPALLEYAHLGKVTGANHGAIANGGSSGNWSSPTFEPTWEGCTGATTTQEYMALYRDGYPEGARALQALRDELALELPRVTSKRRRRRHAEEGDDLDADRYLSHQYEAMWTNPEATPIVGSRVLDVGIDYSGQSNMDAESMQWIGATFVLVCDLLEAAGYRVRLRLLHAVQSPLNAEGYRIQDILVKEPGETVQLDLMALLALPQTYRRYALLSGADVPTKLTSTLGTRVSYKVPDLKEFYAAVEATFPLDFKAPEVRVPMVFTRAAAIQAVRDTLATLTTLEETALASR